MLREARRLLYRLGPETYRDAASLALAWSGDPAGDPYWRDAIGLPSAWQAPRFPLGGRDILGLGTARGSAVGDMLRSLEAWWIDQDFQPDESRASVAPPADGRRAAIGARRSARDGLRKENPDPAGTR